MNCLQNSEEYNHELNISLLLMVVQRIPGHICGDRMVLLFLLKKKEQVSGIPLWMDLIR